MEPLTVEQARAALAYDPATGDLRWRVSAGRRVKVGAAAGTPFDGYVRVCLGGARYMAHRLAWLIHHGAWPSQQIDHINGDRRDNRIANLRDVSCRENIENKSRAVSTNALGVAGVCRYGDRFHARIKVQGRSKFLGSFETADGAQAAYLAAKRLHHAGFVATCRN